MTATELNIESGKYFNVGEYAAAETAAHEAMAAARLENDRQQEAAALNNLGNVTNTRGDSGAAATLHQQAMTIYQELDDKEGIAITLSYCGRIYGDLSDYAKALECFEQSVAISKEIGQKEGLAVNLGNLGVVYLHISDYSKALECYQEAMLIHSELGRKDGIAINLANTGVVYKNLSDNHKALEYYYKAMEMYEEIGRKSGMASTLGNIGSIYGNLLDYDKSLECFQKALAIAEELGNKFGIATHLCNIGIVYNFLQDYPKALEYFHRALSMYEGLGKKNGIAIALGNIGQTYATVEFDGYNAERAEEYLLQAITLFEEVGAKQHLYGFHQRVANLYEHEKQWEKFALHYKKYHEIEKEVQSEETQKQARIMEQRRQAAEREKEIEIERTRASAEKKILNNILPEEITARLIQGESPIADHFDSVSVLFMDIVGFTKLASVISAQQLVLLINAIFSAADGVMREFGMEKIKTIGDAYMAVAGVPVPRADHAECAARASLKLIDLIQNFVVTFPESYGDRSWIDAIPKIQVRIGLHCGPAAAGVVGENKFAYDLWGDAVNTASRMESHGEAGKIHVSEEFLKKLLMVNGEWLMDVADEFSSLTINHLPLTIIPRGEMAIKGKGKMKTYFLEQTT
ncbi:MAG: tetratricopeptide repeat protein [Ignavibacteria bacterium]|nr:tetratricopeptide repeat protein [Ignavibacteria bacterium]